MSSRAARADVREGGRWTPAQRLKNDCIFSAISVAVALLLVLPRRLLGPACRALALVAFVLLGRARRLARSRLGRASGRPVSLRRVARAFLQMGELLADTLALLDPAEPPERGLALEAASAELLRAALAEGRGVVFVSAHLGPFERMAALLAARGFPVAAVARRSYDPRLTGLYERLRAPRGVRSIYRGDAGAATAMVRELARGRALGLMADLPGRSVSTSARMLGEQGPFALGPARIALRRRAAVVVGTPTVGGGGSLLVTLTRIETEDLEACPAGYGALTERLAAELDRRIGAWPDAWLGLYAEPAHALASSERADGAAASVPADGAALPAR